MVGQSNKTLEAIGKVLAGQRVSNQQQLIKLLRGWGITLSQSSASKYLASLGAYKESDPLTGKSYYKLPQKPSVGMRSTSVQHPTQGFMGCSEAQNLLILHIENAYIGVIAEAIDALHSPLIAGIVTGWKSVVIIPKDGVSTEEVKRGAVSQIIHELI